MLSMMAILLAACASEDIAQDKKKENGTEAPKGGVIFAANGPKTSAKRRFIDEDEFAGAKTRTDIKHTPGNGADAYWTSGDYIWVKKQDGTWAKSTAITLHDGGASAEFTLPGSKTDYADGCEVRYTTAGNFLSYAPANLVYFPQNQSRTIANDFSKAGEWGDCGSGVAHNTGNPDKFNFTLSHKSSYLCFLPRCTNAALAPNIRLKGIKVTANQATSKASFFPGFHSFNGDDIDYIGTPTIRRSIEIILPDFPLSTTENQAANATYLVVPPDTYDFKIEYTIKDPTTNIEAVVTDTRTGITLDKGNIYDVTADLIPPPSNLPKYYMWDAEQDYWHGYESEQPFIKQGQPGATQGPNYPKNNADPQHRWYNESYPGYGHRDDAKTALFKTLPNANEIVWYSMWGDAHWDDNGYTFVTVSGGHLQGVTIGGIWLLKKEAIVRRLTDSSRPYHYPATLTWEKMKEAYGAPGTSAAPIDNPRDMRIGGGHNVGREYVIYGRPSNTEISDYFFLPAFYWYRSGWLENNFGEAGCYWSSSAALEGTPQSYYLLFSPSRIGLYICDRDLGMPAWSFE